LLEIVRDRKTALFDLATAEQELNQARTLAQQEEIRRQEELNQKYREQGLQQFEDELELKRLEFEMSKRTDVEKRIFAIEQEKLKLQKILELNEQFGGNLTETQKQIIRAQMQQLDQELSGLQTGQTGTGIFGALGLSPTQEQQTAMKSTYNQAKSLLTDYVNFQAQMTQKLVQDANSRVNAAQTALQSELDAQRQGLANRADTARQELDMAKKNQAEALKQQKDAEKQQRKIQTVQQISNLVTATSKIWSQMGFPAALPAIGLMWGSFALSKIKAATLAKQEFGQGGLEFLDYGGTHASGNDIPIGMTKTGKQRTAERGEALAVINRRNTRKYRHVLPQIIEHLNAGTFETAFNLTPSNQTVVNLDTSKMENSLDQISRFSRTQVWTDTRGRKVERYKNRIRKYA